MERRALLFTSTNKYKLFFYVFADVVFRLNYYIWLKALVKFSGLNKMFVEIW